MSPWIFFQIDYPHRLAVWACALIGYFLFVTLLKRWLNR